MEGKKKYYVLVDIKCGQKKNEKKNFFFENYSQV